MNLDFIYKHLIVIKFVICYVFEFKMICYELIQIYKNLHYNFHVQIKREKEQTDA